MGHAPIDSTYQKITGSAAEISHLYGSNIHILADCFLLTHLAKLCAEDTTQPAINSIIKDLYLQLIRVVLNGEFPRLVGTTKTRMASVSPFGYWTGEVLNRQTKTVTVNILRAGALPSQVCYDYLNKSLDPSLVRQDYVIMSRMTDSKGHVIGSHLGDSKIGGPIDDTIVLIADPMGATGSSLSEVIQFYKEKVGGVAKKFVTVNLIVTPEYLKKINADHPEVVVYAVRLDRGGSPAHVLKEMPGKFWDQEIGLTDKQYIVPGGGGFGEILNNSYC